jgi:hypothetical protein
VHLCVRNRLHCHGGWRHGSIAGHRGDAAATPRLSSRAQKCRRLSVREPEHPVLARPADRRVEHAGDADPMWQAAIDGGLDEARREEGERDRHVDVTLAAGLPCRDAVDCYGAGLDLGQPLPSACNGGDELRLGVGADRKDLCS